MVPGDASAPDVAATMRWQFANSSVHAVFPGPAELILQVILTRKHALYTRVARGHHAVIHVAAARASLYLFHVGLISFLYI